MALFFNLFVTNDVHFKLKLSVTLFDILDAKIQYLIVERHFSCLKGLKHIYNMFFGLIYDIIIYQNY